jgi:hypothetical protein
MKLLDDPKIPTPDESSKAIPLPQASRCCRQDGIEAGETLLHEAPSPPPERHPCKPWPYKRRTKPSKQRAEPSHRRGPISNAHPWSKGHRGGVICGGASGRQMRSDRLESPGHVRA